MYRVTTYIDGFNLYFGLKTANYQRYYWLDVQRLAQQFIRPDQVLTRTKYFTAVISGPSEKRKRQETYIDALKTLPDFDISYGQYRSNARTCEVCGAVRYQSNEKMTDVNIAVELLSDAFQNNFDTAFLISADSDLCAPLSTISRLFPEKRVIVIFPPNRRSEDLKRLAKLALSIDHRMLAKSQLPNRITTSSGFILERPQRWT